MHGRPKRFQFCASIFAYLCRAARDTIALDTKYIKRITVNGIFNGIFFFLAGLVLKKEQKNFKSNQKMFVVSSRGAHKLATLLEVALRVGRLLPPPYPYPIPFNLCPTPPPCLLACLCDLCSVIKQTFLPARAYFARILSSRTKLNLRFFQCWYF